MIRQDIVSANDPRPGHLARTRHPWRPAHALVLASALLFEGAPSWLCLVLKAGQTQPEIISRLWIDSDGRGLQ